MYYDEDGDLAHEFYEETIVTKNGRKRAKLKRIHKNLIPQVARGERWGKGSATVTAEVQAFAGALAPAHRPFSLVASSCRKVEGFLFHTQFLLQSPGFCVSWLTPVSPAEAVSGEEKLVAPTSSPFQREAVPQPF